MNLTERPGNEDEQLFEELLQLETEAERTTFLKERCAGSPELREWLESLLEGYLQSDFMETLPSSLGQMMDVPQRLIGKEVGRFEILEGLGSGGMGDVYLACDREDRKQRVAIKVIKPGMDSRQIIRRFELERQILERLDHPHIARFIESGTTVDGYVYFAMEQVPGIPLDAFCDRMRLTIRDRVELAIRICQAVSHAHDKGVIHRDLKPSNILVFQKRGEAIPKVIDFGIAKALTTGQHQSVHLTFASQWVGTSRYASPEQRSWASDVDPRSDVYSLGMILLELLFGFSHERVMIATGSRSKSSSASGITRLAIADAPTHRDVRTQIDDVIAEARRASVRELTTWLRGPLGWITFQALREEREARYESMSALQADLEAWLQGRPVEATRYRDRRFVSAITYSTGVGVLFFGILCAVWVWRKDLGLLNESPRLILNVRRALAFEVKEAFAAIEQGDQTMVANFLGNWKRATDSKHLGFAVNWIDEYHKVSLATPLMQAPGWRSCSTHPSGNLIAMGSQRGYVTLFDGKNGQKVWDFKVSDVEISSLSFSPNGAWLAIGAKDGLIRIWGLESRSVVHVFAKHQNTVSALVWSPDSKWLCSGDRFGAMELWEVLSWRHIGTMNDRGSHDSSVRELTWSPDGKWIAAATKKEGTLVWPAHQWTVSHKVGDGDSTGVCFSPDSRFLGTTNYASKLTIMSMETGEVEYAMTMPTPMSTVQFNSGNALLAGSHGGMVYGLTRANATKTWFIQSSRQLRGQEDRLESCDWNEKRGMFVFFTPSEEKDCLVQILSESSVFGYSNPDSALLPVGVAASQRLVLSQSRDHSRLIWSELESGEVLKDSPFFSSPGAPFAECPTGKKVAVARNAGELRHRIVQLLDCSTMESQKELELLEFEIADLTFSPDGKSLAIGCDGGQLWLWDFDLDRVRRVDLGDVKNRRVQPLFSPDGSRLVAIPFYHERLQIWDSRGKSRLGVVEYPLHCNRGVFHPDGRLFVARQAEVSIVDVEKAREVDRLNWSPNGTLHSTRDNVENLALSPDGSVLALSIGPRIHLWDWETKMRLKVFGVPANGDDVSPTNRWLRFLSDRTLLHVGRYEGFITSIGAGSRVCPPANSTPFHPDLDLSLFKRVGTRAP
ncbi:Serine/threonine-protein kinase StkP [Pirellula sp. SH-Sr6A]|uniref:serine/threonine-protein kinase n=1 Tax=Pirellula sp. SH-Sr6A TaxID=1632865 RepID=UPI00078E77B5|nr:serine/threonine-protein kinase [Pirellula sp. SH-Sr6A]AMV31381.1 Serine/threonine-protein kinase StkP [Pirellula sp. SH-Sr6A]